MGGKYSECKAGHRVITISWSQLKTHMECKQRASLYRQGKRAKMVDQRIFFPGTVTDRVVRQWLEESPGDLGRMPSMVEGIIERELAVIHDEGGQVKWKSLDDRASITADCIEAVTNIEPDLMKFVVPYEFQPAYRFRTPMFVPDPRGGEIEIMLIGEMDIKVHRVDMDWWFIFDVKHTRDTGYWRKTQGQLTFYDLQNDIQEGQPSKARALLQPLCPEPVKQIKLDDAKRSEMLARVTSMVKDIVMEDFPVREDRTKCGFCDAKHACIRFQPVINADGRKTLAF